MLTSELRFCVDEIAVCNSCNNFWAVFWLLFCDHFSVSFGEQSGYKIFLHLATLAKSWIFFTGAGTWCRRLFCSVLPFLFCKTLLMLKAKAKNNIYMSPIASLDTEPLGGI